MQIGMKNKSQQLQVLLWKGGNRTMKNKNLIKILGFAATVISLGASIVTDWVNEQKMDEKIEEKVNEVLANKTNEES